MLLPLVLAACSPEIWNASDLAEWVRDEAVAREGCVRETIELEDWYRSDNGSNAWHGRCSDANGGARDFAIVVDGVWTPSADQG